MENFTGLPNTKPIKILGCKIVLEPTGFSPKHCH